jgi:hypothetical protein
MKLKDKTEVQIPKFDRLLSFIVKMFSLLIRSSISFLPKVCLKFQGFVEEWFYLLQKHQL